MNDSLAELLGEAMIEQGFKPIPVGPGPINARTRKKAPAKKKRATRGTSGATSKNVRQSDQKGAVNHSVIELFEEAIRKQGLKRIPVGPRPLDRRTRKKASAKEKPVARRRSGARSRTSKSEEGKQDEEGEAANRWFAELFEQEMKRQGFKRVPVGPGPINARTRKKASAGKKSATRRTSGARSKSRGKKR